MNPFDLRGPEFLAFYAVLATAVIGVGAILVRRRPRGAEPGPPRMGDPYSLAILRGGVPHAIRTALLALTERGVLLREKHWKPAPGAAARVRDPLEAAVVAASEAGATAAQVLADRGVVAAASRREADLVRRGLLVDASGPAAAIRPVALGILAATAAIKVLVALSRGRTNVGFLLVLAIAACVIAAKALRPPRLTAAGRRLLADTSTLLGKLRRGGGKHLSASPPERASELALLTAVLGGRVLAGWGPAYLDVLFPRPPGGSSKSSSSESSWGSCGGAACGTGCSGGCGGGCGGCGS